MKNVTRVLSGLCLSAVAAVTLSACTASAPTADQKTEFRKNVAANHYLVGKSSATVDTVLENICGTINGKSSTDADAAAVVQRSYKVSATEANELVDLAKTDCQS